jgi:uncharacterized membrane protein/ABC-type glycerol-3-phosphate transport system permease component
LVNATENPGNYDSFSLIVSVNQLKGVDVKQKSITLSGDQGTNQTEVITINNTGNTDLNISFSTTALSYENYAISTSNIFFNPSSLSINYRKSNTTTLKVSIPSNQEMGLYSGTATATGSSSDTFTINVLVNEVICDNGDLEIEAINYDDKVIQGDTLKVDVTVENKKRDVDDVIIKAWVYDETDKKIIESDSTNEFDLDEDEDITKTIKLKIPSDADEDNTYRVYVKAYAANHESEECDEESFEIEIKEEERCNKGDIEITDIDLSPSKPYPGSTLEIGVDVENRHSDTNDVVIEAWIYDEDEDEKIVGAETEEFDMSEDEEYTKTIELEIPTDVDVNHDFILYIQAYEDGDKDDECYEETKNIDIRKKSHDIAIEYIKFYPSCVALGSSGEIAIKVVNVGKNDEEDIRIKIKNDLLSIKEVSSKFDLEHSNDNDVIKRFDIGIPSNATKKEYDIEVRIYNDNIKKTEIANFTVSDCSVSSSSRSEPTFVSFAPTTPEKPKEPTYVSFEHQGVGGEQTGGEQERAEKETVKETATSNWRKILKYLVLALAILTALLSLLAFLIYIWRKKKDKVAAPVTAVTATQLPVEKKIGREVTFSPDQDLHLHLDVKGDNKDSGGDKEIIKELLKHFFEGKEKTKDDTDKELLRERLKADKEDKCVEVVKELIKHLETKEKRSNDSERILVKKSKKLIKSKNNGFMNLFFLSIFIVVLFTALTVANSYLIPVSVILLGAIDLILIIVIIILLMYLVSKLLRFHL